MPLSPRDRRLLFILGGLAIAAVLVFFFLVLTGGGGEEAAAPSPLPIGGNPSPHASATPTPRHTLPPVVLAGGRDPFSIPPALAPTPSGGVTPTPSGSASPGGGGGGPGGQTIGRHSVTLVDVFTRNGQPMVQVDVDGTVFTVGEGDRFAHGFQVQSINDPCATFLFGDQSFTLCVSPRK